MTRTLGPYLILDEQNKPVEWCCFGLEENENKVSVYTAPYGDEHGVQWQPRTLDAAPFSVFYVYNPLTTLAQCYMCKQGKLYQIPKLAGDVVSRIDEPSLGKEEISWPLTSEPIKARNFGIEPQKYKRLGESDQAIISGLMPELPLELRTPAPSPVTTMTNSAFSIDQAKALLSPIQCHRVQGEVSADKLSSGTMNVWKDEAEIWHYQTLFLGQMQLGVFDSALDKKAISSLEQLQPDQLIDKANHPAFEGMFNSIMRPYLHLSPSQQASIVAALHEEWPLSSQFTSEEQRQICVAIVNKQRLTGEAGTAADDFRRLLVSSALAELTGPTQTFYPSSSKEPGYTTTIADIWQYVNALLVASAAVLGQHDLLIISPPPRDSHVRTDAYDFPLGRHQLLYTGLSTLSNELYELVLNYTHKGIGGLSLEELNLYKKYLEGMIGRTHVQTYNDQTVISDATSDLLASIAAQHNVSSSEAKRLLNEQCTDILDNITKSQILHPVLQILDRLDDEEPTEEIWDGIIDNKTQFFHALRVLDSNDKIRLLSAFQKSQLISEIDNPTDLAILLNVLPSKEQKRELLALIGSIVTRIIPNIDQFITIYDALPSSEEKTQFREVCNEKLISYLQQAQSIDWYRQIEPVLKRSSREQKIIILKALEPRFPEIVTSTAYILSDHFSTSDRTFIINSLGDGFLNLLKKPTDFSPMLQCLSPQQRTYFVPLMNSKLIEMVQNLDGLSNATSISYNWKEFSSDLVYGRWKLRTDEYQGWKLRTDEYQDLIAKFLVKFSPEMMSGFHSFLRFFGSLSAEQKECVLDRLSIDDHSRLGCATFLHLFLKELPTIEQKRNFINRLATVITGDDLDRYQEVLANISSVLYPDYIKRFDKKFLCELLINNNRMQSLKQQLLRNHGQIDIFIREVGENLEKNIDAKELINFLSKNSLGNYFQLSQDHVVNIVKRLGHHNIAENIQTSFELSVILQKIPASECSNLLKELNIEKLLSLPGINEHYEVIMEKLQGESKEYFSQHFIEKMARSVKDDFIMLHSYSTKIHPQTFISLIEHLDKKTMIEIVSHHSMWNLIQKKLDVNYHTSFKETFGKKLCDSLGGVDDLINFFNALPQQQQIDLKPAFIEKISALIENAEQVSKLSPLPIDMQQEIEQQLREQNKLPLLGTKTLEKDRESHDQAMSATNAPLQSAPVNSATHVRSAVNGIKSAQSSFSKEQLKRNPPAAEDGETEKALKQKFINAHTALFNKQKSEFGACLRNSIYFNRALKKLDYTKNSLENILAHAVNNNNRSRQVCINLGWLDKNGNLNNSKTKLPEAIKQLYLKVKGSYAPLCQRQ